MDEELSVGRALRGRKDEILQFHADVDDVRFTGIGVKDFILNGSASGRKG